MTSRVGRAPAGRFVRAALPVTITITALVSLNACANRPPRLVEAVQPHDRQMNCRQLRSEISATQRLLGSYSTDYAQQSDRNRQAALGAVLMPIALMNLDTGNASESEAGAYSQRLLHLQKIATEKDCKDD